MRPVYIAGIGQTSIAEHWDKTAQDLAHDAASQALHGYTGAIGAVYVANALSAALGNQSNLAPAVAPGLGLRGVETLTIEAGGAAGGMAIRQAQLAVAAGVVDAVLVVGVEKVSDVLDERRESALALSMDADWEAFHGVTVTAQWAMLMRSYMHTYALGAQAFAPFPVNAHANGVHNKNALYRFAINADKYQSAAAVAAPLGLLDCSTEADGAAAVLISATPPVGAVIRIAGSAVASDTVALHARADLLQLDAVRWSFERAMAQAGVERSDVDVFEVTDPHAIAAILAFEAMGYAASGTGHLLGSSGAIRPDGSVPVALAGGCKARGNVLGALGVLQIVELTQQLQGNAPTQVADARVGLAQCMSGIGSTVATHILVRDA
ncbi:MAG: acetyl-CoA acetyltransferase [Chloroflexi bacterium]|nr:MAG: acetyl-CoA acetyltransferase [Chloroflexota bacterium]